MAPRTWYLLPTGRAACWRPAIPGTARKQRIVRGVADGLDDRGRMRVLARRAPGGPSEAEPGAAPGRGGAQRSRLDPVRLNSATRRYTAFLAVTSPPSVPPRQPVSTFRLCCL